MLPDLRAAALTYGKRGLAVVATTEDEDGIAKVPMSDFYPRFKPEENGSHDWNEAEGLGIVLGRPSGNLAVIDVDDTGLAEFLQSRLSAWERPPLMTMTPRPGLHIWIVEPQSSKPLDLEAHHQGRKCLVQILGGACQAAAPPTPGYRWIDSKAEPIYGQALDVWRRMSLEFGVYYRTATPYSFLRRERSRPPNTAQLREAADVGG